MESMRHLLAFLILAMLKIISSVFYRRELTWLNEPPENPFDKARVFVLLNHTSLYEPVYLSALSFRYLWKLTKNLSVPGADVTLKRPIVGLFWKLMMPNISSVSRKSDNTWRSYLESIKKDSIVLIAPEGRMKRPNGLDKNGRPMTVKPGIADIIMTIPEGGMILCLSGGLHHIQKPGEHFPKVFKTIRMNFVYLELSEYRKKFPGTVMEQKLQITKDLQKYLETSCPVQKV
jgi:1-acyl-sn-glycerol-3-phosphate acyltransferase